MLALESWANVTSLIGEMQNINKEQNNRDHSKHRDRSFAKGKGSRRWRKNGGEVQKGVQMFMPDTSAPQERRGSGLVAETKEINVNKCHAGEISGQHVRWQIRRVYVPQN